MFRLHTLRPHKILFAITIILVSMNLSGQIIEIADPVLHEFILNNYTSAIGTDEAISEAEALNITGTLDLSGQNINSLGGLERLTQLDTINVAGLGLIEFPSPTKLVKWSYLDLSENNLEELPNLNNIPNLKRMKISGNKLTFQDLLPLAVNSQLSIVQDSDLIQQQIDIVTNLNVEIGKELIIELGIDSAIEGNLYKWFKNGNEIGTGSSNQFTRESVSSLDDGNYYCEVTNPNFPVSNFKLKTKTVSVSIIGEDITITDVNVRECLSKNYPELINNAQRLNKSAAQNYDGTIDCSNLEIERFPEITYFKSITSLDLSQNKLASLEGLQYLQQLQELNLNNNSLTVAPVLSTVAPISKVDLSNNELENLPNYTFEKLSELNLKGNKLTFKDFTQFVTNENLANYVLAPQSLVGPAPSTDTVSTQGTIIISLNIDEEVSGNLYEWYLNNTFYTSTTINKLVLHDAIASDNGTYYAIVRNTNFSDNSIFLKSHNYQIVVGGCYEPNNIIIDIDPVTCQTKGSIQIDESSLMGASFPVSYEIIDQSNNQHMSSDNGRFEGLDQGAYTLIITQEDQCTFVLKDAFELSISSDNCDIVIGPNGSSQSYYIEAEGTAKIYNSAGQLVRELTIPGNWDGKTNTGHIQSDQYFIQVNEDALIPVSVVR